MRFTTSELEMISQYAATTKADTLARLKETVPVIEDTLTRVIVRNAIEKLQKVPEPECSRFIADTKKFILEEKRPSVLRRLAEAKAKTREPALLGHDLSGKERFMPETRHMVTLDVLNNDSPVGYKGESYRLFLSDREYIKAKESEQRGEIKIKKYAAVLNGHLYPDRKAKGQER